MQLKKLSLLIGCLIVLGTAVHAQKTAVLERAVESAVSRQAVRRYLPTFRDGIRNRLYGRLGPALPLRVTAPYTSRLPVPALNFKTGKTDSRS